ncbi:ECF transporter S component [Mammaliicoccus stepanovicii]|uniref:Substrate-specific component YkoE of thiamin-regulated ECF transporter for HydroxymethylPyrimidine n=1 Tax=Mammaliicoccus stepanovicii TaxID=643214 RepID=A0A239ZQ64_9STAP|nr:ECF transporter S component [Mammaliicoccus stepanovicii]PNZ75985.1 thiamine ABC transporter permease [Mammaliicoccus stepanovicii]GGI41415.1 thiamine ABC transporter permease [Mammaliicoccus stepanovicii]SNV72923.1 substrate-specific component YkoE of thiamin-regulated ECF transporter for HydroxymethylPyrimidine [Mammaliicoccus stepanovicii]
MVKKLTLSDILVTVLIGAVFAIIYKFLWIPYEVLKPLGLHLEQSVYGLWFIAAIVTYLIIQKPGVALIAEFAAGAGETIVLGQFDIPTFVYAILQGLACELVFLAVRYQSRKLSVAVIAGIAASIITLPIDWFYNYLSDVATWNVILMFTIRILSGAIVGGALGYAIVKSLDKTGVTKLFRPSSKKDYDLL